MNVALEWSKKEKILSQTVCVWRIVRGPRRTGRSRAPAGEDSWFSAGEGPPFEAVPLRPKTSSPNVRETKGIC